MVTMRLAAPIRVNPQVNRKSILGFSLKIRSVHSLHTAPPVVKDQAALENVIGVLNFCHWSSELTSF